MTGSPSWIPSSKHLMQCSKKHLKGQCLGTVVIVLRAKRTGAVKISASDIATPMGI